MVEIAICLAVIAFALVAIIGVLPIGMSVQKDNREETIINFDANYLMEAIRSGARGMDSLTNYVICITNQFQAYVITGNPPNTTTNQVAGYSGINWYTNTSVGNPYSESGTRGSTNFLVNGANIIGLLTTPKYTPYSAQNGIGFVSNYITADFRAITGSPVDQGVSQTSKDFAFSYRVYPEINPVVTDASLLAGNAALTMPLIMQGNLADIRLRFRWPVLPANQLGPSTAVYRTLAGGSMVTSNSVQKLYFFNPQTYTYNSANGPVP